ncbi:BglG family transcription antiterminator [Bacillus sp. V3-13]|uniref:BglG family transcription antiterminator n=1 Tax=Bacillus sp. V3-13 TaxID=2053728 RepID=UPI0015E11968|nr:BglG family transcription antiterminator [Bacillus sp. V3-13]
MNKRQAEILLILLENEQKDFSVQMLADKVDCSEKTIRNDFKMIDDWLEKESNIVLVRKPSVGVYLEGSKEDKNELLQKVKLEKGEGISENVRKLTIVKMLLLTNDILTMQELASEFFISKAVVRNDLEEIEEWLRKYHLQLIIKPKQGIRIVGNERDRRIAFAQITQMLMQSTDEERKVLESIFSPGDIVIVKNGLKKIERQLGYSFTDEALENLITHILISIKRVKLGNKIRISTEDLYKVRDKPEYAAVQSLIGELEKMMAVKLPQEEVAYMTLRLLGTKIYYNFTIDPAKHNEELFKFDPAVVSYAKKLISTVSDVSGERFDADEYLLLGLVSHLQTAFYRLKNAFPVANPMLHEIKRTYFSLFEIIYYVLPTLEEELDIFIPEDEIAYIVLHFQASLERMQKRNAENLKVLIVCSMGIGMSQLLQTKLERKFHSLNIVGATSVNEAKKEIQTKNPDFIISTVPFESEGIPIIKVSPLLMLDEERKIDEFIHSYTNDKDQLKYPAIRLLLDEDLMFVNVQPKSRAELIEQLADAMEEKGFTDSRYKESILQREQQSSTVINGGIAIPHGSPDFVHEARIAVAVFNEPIQWGNNPVSIVFMLAISHKDKGLLKELFKDISRLADDEQALTKLKELKTLPEILDFF